MVECASKFGWARVVRMQVAVAMMLLAIGVCAGLVSAASVGVDVSSRNVYVGIPFTLSITVTGADGYDDPQFAQMDGIQVSGGPSTSQSTRITTVNGKMSQQRDVVLSYSLIASAEGDFIIPAISVTADGTLFRSRPIAIHVTAPEAGDALLAELTAAKSTIYLGEPIELTLHIWIKPFADPNLRVRLGGPDMWGRIDLNNSQWGPFVPAIEKAIGPRGIALEGKEVLRQQAVGDPQPYYLHEFTIKDWPTSAGRVEMSPVRIVMQYPVRLERRRDVFVNGLSIAEQRPIVVMPTMPELKVVSPPAQGQPEIFSGAVGQFDVKVAATPSRVSVGDPITITMSVRDVTEGGARLELLSPPPLQRMSTLTRDFRVPSEPMTGTVSGNTKTFRQTIRANSSNIRAIPPISFAYFDPELEQYRTVSSDPIAIDVQPAREVSAADVVGGGNGRPAEATQLTQLEGGLVANKTGAALLLADQQTRIGWSFLLILGLPPLVFGVIALQQRRARRSHADVAAGRVRRAARVARKRLGDAHGLKGGAQADAVAAAISGYVADRTRAQAESMTRDDVLGRLQSWKVSQDLVMEVERLLQTCDELRFGSPASSMENSIVERAGRCVDQLEKRRSA